MNLNGKNEGRVGKIDFGMALPAEISIAASARDLSIIDWYTGSSNSLKE